LEVFFQFYIEIALEFDDFDLGRTLFLNLVNHVLIERNLLRDFENGVDPGEEETAEEAGSVDGVGGFDIFFDIGLFLLLLLFSLFKWLIFFIVCGHCM